MKLAAIDLGASGGRVLLAQLVGPDSARRIEIEEVHRFAHGPTFLPNDHGTSLHWDAIHLWREIVTGLRKLGQAHGRPDSIGVDTWGVDFALLDERGGLLANPIAYRDPYTEGQVEQCCALIGRDELFRRTGLQFMAFNSLFQLKALRDQATPYLGIARHFLMVPDLFHYWLCGEKAVEYTIASTSQMVGAESRAWDLELLDRLELPTHILPEIVEPGTTLGRLRGSVADEIGLPADVPIICPPGHDTAAAVVATPGQGNDWAFLSAGTWCLFGAEVDRPYLAPSVLQNGFGNEGGVRGTIRLLRNITGLWLVQECRRYWETEGQEYSYAELARLASEARPFVAIIDPDDAAFAQPTRMPQAIAAFCQRNGQSQPESVGEFVRVSLEGIALATRRRWDQLQAVLGRRFRVLNIVGGGTQNALLCQFIANAIGCPVLAGPTEATAIGNALVQAIGHGALNYTEAREVVRRSTDLREYHPQDRAAWDDAYARFLQVVGGAPSE